MKPPPSDILIVAFRPVFRGTSSKVEAEEQSLGQKNVIGKS